MFKSWSFGARRIQTQLVVWTALILVLSVVIISEIRTRSSVRLLQNYLQDRAESEVRTVANALNLSHTRAAALQIPVIDRRLREFVEGDPTLDRMDITAVARWSSVCAVQQFRRGGRKSHDRFRHGTDVRKCDSIDSEQMLVTSFRIEDSDLVLVAYSSLSNIEQFQDIQPVADSGIRRSSLR